MREHLANSILLMATIVLMAGCTPQTYLVVGDSSKIPKTPGEYHDFLQQSNRLKEADVIPADIRTVEKRLTKAAGTCYQAEVSTQRQGAEMFAERLNGTVTRLGKESLFFCMQIKGERNTKTVYTDGKGTEPEGGLFMYGVEFTRVDAQHTQARYFAPWGWGGVAKNVIAVADGGYGDQCPKPSEIFVGARAR